jgi:hypothetical protein
MFYTLVYIYLINYLYDFLDIIETNHKIIKITLESENAIIVAILTKKTHYVYKFR